MDALERAKRVIAKLTDEDRIKLRQCVDKCLSAAIMFNKTRKAEYFTKMKDIMENFMKTLELLEKED